MVRTLRPQPGAGHFVHPQSPPLRLLRRNLEPLPPPDPLDPLEIGPPRQRLSAALRSAAKHSGHIEARARRYRPSEPPVPGSRRLGLGRAMLSEHTSGETFANSELLPDALNAGPATGGALGADAVYVTLLIVRISGSCCTGHGLGTRSVVGRHAWKNNLHRKNALGRGKTPRPVGSAVSASSPGLKEGTRLCNALGN
jgi:hypothetical protein